jgi:hypothetical protein
MTTIDFQVQRSRSKVKRKMTMIDFEVKGQGVKLDIRIY